MTDYAATAVERAMAKCITRLEGGRVAGILGIRHGSMRRRRKCAKRRRDRVRNWQRCWMIKLVRS
jgi:hypothetical protein